MGTLVRTHRSQPPLAVLLCAVSLQCKKHVLHQKLTRQLTRVLPLPLAFETCGIEDSTVHKCRVVGELQQHKTTMTIEKPKQLKWVKNRSR
eukprot:1910452-Amphidinium_carterae.1